MRRNEFDCGSQPVRNLLTNPAVESVGNRDLIIRTNLVTNPSMRNVSTTPQTMRTNLISNSAMEASGAAVAVRTNLITNPGVEASAGLINTRVNLVNSPRGVNTLNPYAVGVTMTPNVSISGGPEGITTALRVTYTTQSNPGVSMLDVAEAGVTYAISAWIYHESVMSTSGSQGFAQAGIQASPNPPAMEVGKWIKMSWVYTPSSTNNIGFRVSANSGTGNGSYLITGMLVEKATTVQPFFDGATTSLNLAKNPSFETNTDLWGAQWYGNGGGTGTFTRVAGAGISGGAAARKTWTTANTTNSLDVGITTTINVIPGQTYTSSIYQKSSFVSALTCYVVWKDAANAVISTTNRSFGVTTPVNTWVRGSCTEVAPANAVTGTFIFGPYAGSGTIPQGGTIDWDWALIEEGDKLNPYYDGSAAAPADFTYTWSGTANNSTSLQRAPQPALFIANNTWSKVWQSSGIAHTGSKSLAVESAGTAGYTGTSFGLSLGLGTYTVSAYVNLQTAFGTSGVAIMAQGAGVPLTRGNSITTTGSWQRTTLTITTTSAGTVTFYLITANNVPAPIGAKFYADSVMVEAGSDVRPYFDGTNTGGNLLSNSSFEAGISGWTNAGNAVGTLSHDTSPTYSGTRSLKVVVDGTSVSQGAFTSSRTVVKPSRWYTASVWVKGDAGKSLRLELGEWDEGSNIVGGSRTSGATVVGTGDWQRLTASRLMGPTASTVDIIVRNSNAVAHTFWIDAAELEEGDTATDFENAVFTYAWTGTANASSSEMRAPSVAGITSQSINPAYQSSEQVLNGTKSLYFGGTSGDIAQNVHTGPTVSGLTVGTTYTLSAWVYVMPGSVGLELQPSGVGAAATGRTTTTGRWERVYQVFAAAATSHHLRLRTTASGKVQAYIGGMLLEQGPTVLPYFDGTNPSYENIATQTIQSLGGGSITTGVSAMGSVWSRVTAVTGASYANMRTSVPLNKLIKWQPYTVSVTVHNEGTSSVSVGLDWCDNNTVQTTIAAGETRRLSTSGTGISTRGYDNTYRFSDLSLTQSATEEKSILVKDWLIERGSTVNQYYTGTGDFTYAWTGAANASTSTQRYYSVLGQSASKGGDANSRFFAYASVDETGDKVVKFLSPAGTSHSGWRVAHNSALDYVNIQAGKSYTLYMRYRVSGWPTTATAAVVQLSDGGNNNQVVSGDGINQVFLQRTGWQEYRRTFTANLNASSGTVVYIGLPPAVDAATDATLEISEAMLLDNSYSGAYFDGSTVSADPDFSYAWNGAVDASTSKMLGTSVIGVGNTITHGMGLSSTEWKSSGTKSIRVVAKSRTNNDSFIDIRSMFSGTFKPNTKYTIAGTRYLKAPLTGPFFGATGFRVNINGDRAIVYKPGYGIVNTAGASRVVATFVTNDSVDPTNFIRIQNSAVEGNGDVWWDDLLLVEGDYDGRHIDGTNSTAKWEGTAHASTSVGYPQTVESLVGMPLFYVETPGTYTLDSSKLGPTEPRMIYSVYDAPVDIPNSSLDVLWMYGIFDLTDAVPNKAITFRYQGEAGPTNAILARRTGGAGPLKAGIPTGRYIMMAGLDESGRMLAGHGGSPTLTVDSLTGVSIPHERFKLENNSATHIHVATYLYRGLHTDAVRAEVIKMLAQRHNVPLLV